MPGTQEVLKETKRWLRSYDLRAYQIILSGERIQHTGVLGIIVMVFT